MYPTHAAAALRLVTELPESGACRAFAAAARRRSAQLGRSAGPRLCVWSPNCPRRGCRRSAGPAGSTDLVEVRTDQPMVVGAHCSRAGGRHSTRSQIAASRNSTVSPCASTSADKAAAIAWKATILTTSRPPHISDMPADPAMPDMPPGSAMPDMPLGFAMPPAAGMPHIVVVMLNSRWNNTCDAANRLRMPRKPRCRLASPTAATAISPPTRAQSWEMATSRRRPDGREQRAARKPSRRAHRAADANASRWDPARWPRYCAESGCRHSAHGQASATTGAVSSAGRVRPPHGRDLKGRCLSFAAREQVGLSRGECVGAGDRRRSGAQVRSVGRVRRHREVRSRLSGRPLPFRHRAQWVEVVVGAGM
jgi:hypothetical protein